MQDRNRGAFDYRGIERRRSEATAYTSVKPAVPNVLDKPSGRHSAIRNTLPTVATYRAWSAKARTEWARKDTKPARGSLGPR
jgi:hypothetical protein